MSAGQSSPDLPARRAFLRRGSLIVGFTLLPAAAWAEFNGMGMPPVANPRLPGNLKSTPWLDAWIRVAPDGTVTVCSGKAELGTGLRTALVQIAAEQLELAPNAVRFIGGDTTLTPNEGFTAGSHSVADSGTALLHASAQVAALLRAGAAAQWHVPAAAVTLRGGAALAPDGRRMHYGAAIAGIDLHRHAAETSPLRAPAQYRLIGKSVPRLDIPAKVTGGAAYVQDMRLPGMLHARVVRPPRPGARLVAADLAAIRRLPGVRHVVRDGSYLAVLADDEWRAVQAMRALEGLARWEGGTPLPAPGDVHALLQHLPAQDITILRKGAPLPAELPPGRSVSARFTKQYVMHASIGPSCAVAHLDGGQLTVWTHTQGVYPLRHALAELTGMALENVRCIHTEGAGCYGQNGADDVAADAALLACAMPGHPVRVQLMREQENLWEPFAPAMVTQVKAALDDAGRISHWDYELWSGSHNERPGNAGKLVPAWLLARPIAPTPSEPMPQPEGGGDRNALPLYALPNARVVNHFLPVTPLRTSAMRSLGAHINIVTIETTMDRLAALAQVDPVQFRLRHLAHEPRAMDVVRAAAQLFHWPRPRSRPWHGTGFGFGQYKNLMAYVAIAVELAFNPDTGVVRILRVAAAADCGQVVNPDGVRNQLEGGIIQSASWTLLEQLRYGPDGIASIDWSSYPILRFSGVPQHIEIRLLDRPGMPFLGVAEAAQGPMAAALANALAQATGLRRDALPLLATQ
ncbi:CO/xanthine dehydrogenase Mo-binding subunit [Pseudoduganella flava]|uniref:CO/xanthine dehydrogenase Mo-binding subunit n=1 Tax=Pseudoduganella flava TaxID=871742 RepID=A0A562P9I3_9BURK|nr:molybdopterin cofactor-binding domain-containing protein [Pseudoduganella flava]QGZ38046.1 molybdopterin-dependent oxidoreductase [Pseudoduganella flava]TWI40983.1 CO/xanthine dehydrogenase Mo-binding subunit [Pseudoduganella flava]